MRTILSLVVLRIQWYMVYEHFVQDWMLWLILIRHGRRRLGNVETEYGYRPGAKGSKWNMLFQQDFSQWHIFCQDKAYSHSVAGSKQSPKIPGWKEVRGRGQWDLWKALSLLLCPLIHLPACQHAKKHQSPCWVGLGPWSGLQYQWVSPTWDPLSPTSHLEFSWLDC